MIQIEAQLPFDDLLKAVERLNSTELEQLALRVMALQAQRKSPHLSQAETELLLKINKGIPADIQARYNELIAKRQSESLTSDEYNELLSLTGQIEKLEAERIEYLSQLTQLHQTSLTALMQDLGIQLASSI